MMPRRPTEDAVTDEMTARFPAALLVAAVGDALGWPQEGNNQRVRSNSRDEPSGRFDRWTRKVGGRFWAAREDIDPGSYSDDTQLLVATTRALVRGGPEWFAWLAHGELPAWLLYERGGGRATKAAAQLWAGRTPPWHAPKEEARRKYFDAGGNGVAMRILPHAFFATPWHVLRQDVLANGAATHGHPRALLGGLLYAAAVRLALQKSRGWELGELLERVLQEREVWMAPPSHAEALPGWHDAAQEVTRGRYDVQWAEAAAEAERAMHTAYEAVHRGVVWPDDGVLEEIGARGKMGGAGTVSAVAAIFLAVRYASDPATGIRVAAYERGIDTDTIASMAGGLLGTMVGDTWLPPWWREVQDAPFLLELARHAALSPTSRSQGLFGGWHEGDLWTDAHSKRLRDHLLECRPGSRLTLGPLGEAVVDEVHELEPVARGVRTTRFRLRSRDGQRVFVLRSERRDVRLGEAGARPETPAAEVTDPSHQRSAALRTSRADLALLLDALPPRASAAALVGLLSDATAELEKIRSAQPLHSMSASEVTRMLGTALARQPVKLPEDALLALGRIAWRLARGTERGAGSRTPPQSDPPADS